MSVYVIWESHFSRENAPAGLETTKAIWRDMESFDGYLDHQLLQAPSTPGLACGPPACTGKTAWWSPAPESAWSANANPAEVGPQLIPAETSYAGPR